MVFENILLKQTGHVAMIVLNRPHALNAMTTAMHKEIFTALAVVRDDPKIRVLILTGAGRGFCSGDDMKESDPRDGAMPPDKDTAIVWHDIVRQMRGLPKPVIAAVNGIACGAGSGLVLGSDIRIASDQARFADIFILRGIAGGACLLTQTVGPSRALELILTGDIIDAKEAHRIGVFNQVVPHDKLEETAMQLATRLAAGPTKSLGLSKQAVYAVVQMGLDDGLRLEEAAKLRSLKSDEVREGIMAFNDKRKAAFGRS